MQNKKVLKIKYNFKLRKWSKASKSKFLLKLLIIETVIRLIFYYSKPLYYYFIQWLNYSISFKYYCLKFPPKPFI